MERLTVDGVPVFWEEGPEPAMVSLMFRSGVADEPAPMRGIGHLVEHLVLFAADPPRHVGNGFVDLLRTVFHARGSQEEVDDFLARVCGQLPVPDLARLDAERRVLRTEAGSVESFLSRQLFSRFGGASFGVADVYELGLRWLTEAEVRDWAAQRMTAGNAALWVHGPRPPETLPVGGGGEPLPPPPAQPRPRLTLPAYVEEGTGGVALAALGERSAALTLALAVASERLHEELRVRKALSYSVGGTWEPLGPRTAHLSIGADSLDEHADSVLRSLFDVLERLAEDGPTREELDEIRGVIRRAEDGEPDPTAKQILDRAALDALLGGQPATLEDLRSEREAVTPEAAAGALGEALKTALVIAPPGTPKPREWLHDYVAANTTPLEGGRTFKPPGLRTHGVRMTVSDAGVSYSDKEGTTTILSEEIVAAVREPPHDLTLIGRDGSTLTVRPSFWRDGSELAAAFERLVDPTQIVPADDGPGADVARLAKAQLRTEEMANHAVAVVPPQLQPGERPEALSVASNGRRKGLLALTDRRVLFLWTGRRQEGVLSVGLDEVVTAITGHIEDEVRFNDQLDVIWRRDGDEHTLTFTGIRPKGRAHELAQEISRLRSA